MAGKSSHEILMEDLRKMEDGMERLSTTKADIGKKVLPEPAKR